MVDTLAQLAVNMSEKHVYVGSGLVDRIHTTLAALPPGTPTRQRWELHMQLGEAQLNLGREAEAIENLTRALELLEEPGFQAPATAVNGTHFRLGVAYIRLAETENCCLRHSPESCILPLRGGALHTVRAPSKRAIHHLGFVVDRTPGDGGLHLAARWLLNIAYMTLGLYPDMTPPNHVIPPSAFESEEDIPRFVDIAARLGLDTFSLSGGAIADDFNGDGYLDLVVSTWDPSGQIRYHRNRQDGTFADDTIPAGLVGIYGGLNLVQADYDNDGDTDIFVLRGAWLGKSGRHPNSLLQNDGAGVFTDVTFDVGLGDVHYPTQTASWGDYDNDGDLDLYIGNESNQAFTGVPNQLFQNDGAGAFVDVAREAGVEDYGPTKAVGFGDYDADGRPDLYVSNLGGPNRLYHNNGDGTFTDVAARVGVTGPDRSFPAWFWDANNDGALDIYVSAYSTNIAGLAAHLLGMSGGDDNLAHLYLGDGLGAFQEVGQAWNLVHPNSPMGSNFGDLDNDGYLDFYLGTGNPDLLNIMPGVMSHNQAGKRFADVSYVGGFAHLQKGHAVVFADLDNDGDQDVFEQMGGAFAADRYRDVLYENRWDGANWLTVELVGVRSNRSAIGARITLEVVVDGEPRRIYRHVNSGGSFGANPLRQTIGIGQAENIERMEVLWPTSGVTQTFRAVTVNRAVRVVEGKNQLTTLPLKRLVLGGGPTAPAAIQHVHEAASD
jgi:hypothetical protein